MSDADRILDRYRKIGAAEKHVYGGRGAGAPNYNVNPDETTHKTEPKPESKPEPKAEAKNPKQQ